MKRLLALSLVGLQFVLLGALVFLPHGSLWPVCALVFFVSMILVGAGVVLAALGVRGLGRALTASPIPKQDAPLVSTGIYGLLRSPIYAGLMLGGLGLLMVGASIWHGIAWVMLIALLAVKTRWEERMLLAEHPEYYAYGARVGRFIPGVGRLRRPPAR